MKKVLAFILAASLCLGAAAIGFAASENGAVTGKSATPGTSSSSSDDSSSDNTSSDDTSSDDTSSDNTSSSSSDSSSESDSGSGSSSFGGSSTTTSTRTETVRESAVISAVNSAIERAISSNSSSANAVLRNVKKVSASVLKNVAEKAAAAASENNVTPKVSFDTMRGGAVLGRLTFDLTKTASLASDINLGVSTSNRVVSNTFEKFFKNETALVDLAHKTSFGTNVEVAVKVDLKNLNTKTLVFYCYDQATNSYFKMDNTGYFIDTNGYVHFTTSMGGSIIITDSALQPK